MELEEALAESVYFFVQSFDHEDVFEGVVELALPVVEGLDGGSDVDAGDEFFFDERAGDAEGVLVGGDGGEGDAGVGHRKILRLPQLWTQLDVLQ